MAGIKESLSLSTFRFSDLLEESWDDAPLREYLESTRFFFVVFQETSRGYVLRGAKFWSMPLFDVEGPVLGCWSETRDIVKEGVRLTIKVGSSGRFTILNNLPGKKENPVTHVRSHSAQAAYLLENGTLIGNIERDGDELPDGRWMTKQSFWLNNDYVEKIIEEVALRGEERDAQVTAEVGADD